MHKKFHKITFRGTLIYIFLFALTLPACGGKPVEIAPAEPAQPGAGELEPTDVPTSTTWPILKTTMGDFAVVSARLVDQAQGTVAPPGQRFLLVGLAGPDGAKLVAGEFSLEAFQKMVLDRQDEIYVLGNDGSQTVGGAMGGWIEDDFVMGFTVPITDTYTLNWPENSPILLNAEVAVIPSPTPDLAVDEPPYYSAVDPALVTKPNVPPQTINGVTATIEWAYADESRVTVMWTISGLDWPNDVQMDSMQMPSLSSTAIHDIDRGAMGLATGIVSDGSMTGYVDQMLTTGAVSAVDTPVVDLQVDVPVDGTGAFIYPAQDTPPQPGQMIQPTPVDLPNVGTFHFAFEIPVYQGVKLMDLNQTVEGNGIAVTLRSLILNRSHADALVCFEMPSAKDWSPDLRFGIGGTLDQDTPQAFGSSLLLGDGKSFTLSDAERCVGMGADVKYDGGSTKVVLTIPKLKASIPEVISEEMVQQANERLADKGIEFEVIAVDHGNNFNILKRPDGMPDTELYPLIWASLGDWYEGPWEFTVEIIP